MRLARNLTAALQVVRALPVRTALLSLPVAASVALALTTLAINHGLTAKAQEAAASFGVDNITIRAGSRVIAGKSGAVANLTEEDVNALRSRLRGAKAIEGTRIEDNVPTSAGSQSSKYKLFGVRPKWAEVRQFGAERGRFFDNDELDSAARVCIIGQTVARELYPNQDPLDQEIAINQVPFTVKGVLVAKGASPAEGDRDARIVIPLTTFYERLYRTRLHLDQIVVQAKDASPEGLARLEEQIKAVLRQQHRIASGQPDDFSVRLPDRIAEESRGLSKNVFNLLLGLALICGVVAVLTLAMVSGQAVRSRQGEIGIRRALGATASDILHQFWTEGVIVSLLGGVLGLILGMAGAWALASWRQLAYGFDMLVVAVPLAVVVLASVAGLFPARSAAALAPAEALRAGN